MRKWRVASLLGWSAALVASGALLGKFVYGFAQFMWLEESLGSDSELLDLVNTDPPLVAALSWMATGVVVVGAVVGVGAAWLAMRAGGIPRPGRRLAGPALVAAVGIIAVALVPMLALPLVLAACLWVLIGSQTWGERPLIASVGPLG
jgi:hypothetical protein